MKNNKRLSKEKSIPETLTSFAKQAIASLYTSLPGKILKYDATHNVADIQLMVEQAEYIDTGLEYLEMPILFEVPIMLTRAGAHVVTLPIQKDDECWVMFSHKSMANFRLLGKKGMPYHLENGGLEDAVAIIKQISIPKNDVKNIKNSTYQIRNSENNDSFVEYSAKDDTTTIQANLDTTAIVAPNVITLKSGSTVIVITGDGTITMNSPTEINLTAPTINLNASAGVKANTPVLTVSGVIAAGSSGSGVSTFTGGLVGSNGDIVADGISLKGHTHPGVTSGPSNTGAPN